MIPLLSLSVQVSYREDGVCHIVFFAHSDMHAHTKKQANVYTNTHMIQYAHTHMHKRILFFSSVK